jgi:hypothetical protein
MAIKGTPDVLHGRADRNRRVNVAGTCADDQARQRNMSHWPLTLTFVVDEPPGCHAHGYGRNPHESNKAAHSCPSRGWWLGHRDDVRNRADLHVILRDPARIARGCGRGKRPNRRYVDIWRR